MKTYCIELSLSSSFITPWHADTIFGHLCWIAERHDGFHNFRGACEFIDLHRKEPPLIISDGFPAGLIPAPANLRDLFVTTVGTDLDRRKYEELKRAKSIRFLTLEQFQKYQRGDLFELGGNRDGFIQATTLHNQIDRLTNTTGKEGSLFELDEQFVVGDKITIYAKIRAGFEEDMRRLFDLFALGGYGRKRSTGKGAFRMERFEKFDGFDVVDTPTGFVSLSHFVPAQIDPTDGSYKMLVKYGKLGEDKTFCGNPFKKPLLMIKPGAVFRTVTVRHYYGRLVENIAYADSSVVQYGFGFAVPVSLQ